MANHEDLSSKYEFNSRVSDGFGYLLLLGLFVELVFVFFLDKTSLEKYSALVSDIFIVVGVWGEIHFAHVARTAGDALQADAEARVAEANRDARAAQLELVKFRKPRREIIRGHEASIIAALRPFAGIRFDTGFSQTDGEAADFAWDLHPILVDAGWEHIDWIGGRILLEQGPERPKSGSVGAANVEIHLHPASRDSLLAGARALIFALSEIGIDATEAGFNALSETNSAMHILIGPKR